ncbi:MAG TPA: hypothetical protein VGI90_19755 [Steroidobacteraceae bacterium]
MTISRIHSYLIHPNTRGGEPLPIGGIDIPLNGKLFNLLANIDRTALRECDIDIVFRPKADGTQQNDSRDSLLSYLKTPSLPRGRAIAQLLQKVTTNRSGLGLLFLIASRDQHGLRLLISRFPAETGVTAEERGQAIEVQFVEKVFMKNTRTYKSALFRCATIQAGFWDGVVVDKQMIDTRGAADYWTSEFLQSNLKNTSAAGTKRVAVALQIALKDATDPAIQQELINASQLVLNRHGQVTSAKKIVQDLSLTQGAAAAIAKAFVRPTLYDSTFKFDREEFKACLVFRSVQLDNGVMLTAENASFDRVIDVTRTRNSEKTRFTTEGNIVSEKLRKSR